MGHLTIIPQRDVLQWYYASALSSSKYMNPKPEKYCLTNRVKMKPCLFSVLITFLVSLSAPCQTRELNTLLMESTYKLQGRSRQDPNAFTLGTAFFLGLPQKKDKSLSYYVLVTAGHVLDEIVGDEAVIFLREKSPNGTFRRFPYTFKIRSDGHNLYVRHPTADVAAMYFRMPLKDPFLLLDEAFLADDLRLQKYEIHPGDELLCLGYPLGAEANEMGFPILRSGKIASYPIVPAEIIKSFLFDFRVFEGNSGGPVYFSYDTRLFGGMVNAGPIQSIVGLVTQQGYSPLPNYRGQPLELGLVVPSFFIIETIKLLPEPE